MTDRWAKTKKVGLFAGLRLVFPLLAMTKSIRAFTIGVNIRAGYEAT